MCLGQIKSYNDKAKEETEKYCIYTKSEMTGVWFSECGGMQAFKPKEDICPSCMKEIRVIE